MGAEYFFKALYVYMHVYMYIYLQRDILFHYVFFSPQYLYNYGQTILLITFFDIKT